MKWQERLTKLVPPGVKPKQELGIFWAGAALALLHGGIRFSDQYGNARADLYTWVGRERVLIPGAVMPSFDRLLDMVPAGFLILGAVLLALVLRHYLSYRRDSMSIYLMRRLPDKNLLHRQCWTLPLLGLAADLLLGLALLGACYLTYRFATPAVCLP